MKAKAKWLLGQEDEDFYRAKEKDLWKHIPPLVLDNSKQDAVLIAEANFEKMCMTLLSTKGIANARGLSTREFFALIEIEEKSNKAQRNGRN